MSSTKKLTIAGLLIALAVILSGFSIPIGVAKVFPIQHMVNLIAAVLLGPLYAVLMAFVTSVIRVSMGTGSLLAFPGSMVGALLAGLMYKKFRSTLAAAAGELIGTGVIGAILAYPVAAFLLSREAALFAFVIPFSLSSAAGAIMGFLAVNIMERTGIFSKHIIEGGSHEL